MGIVGNVRQCLHTPGMTRHCVVTLGDHNTSPTAQHDHIRRVANTVFDRLNCGLGVVGWCACHLQLLGPPWGTEGNACTSQG